MSVTNITYTNPENNVIIDKWIDYSCEKKNITLQDLHQVCQQQFQQVQMTDHLPPQMGGRDITYNESLNLAWIPSILERIEQRANKGEY